MADHAEHISTFEAVTGAPKLIVCHGRGRRGVASWSASRRPPACCYTGADAETAKSCLSAMRWDLDRAVNFFMEYGADGMSMLPQPASHEVVDLSDDDSPAAPRPAPASTANDAHDPELQDALAASRRAGDGSTAPAPWKPVAPGLDDVKLPVMASLKTVCALLADGAAASTSVPTSHPSSVHVSESPHRH